MKKSIICSISIMLLVCGSWTSMLAQKAIKIAIVPKSAGLLFWKSVHAGAKLGAMGSAEIIWKAPDSETDSKQQISIVESCISEDVSGIILSPINFDEPLEAVAKAMKKKIPVLIFDSRLKGTAGKDFICFVGIDNRKAGKAAGVHLASLLNGKGNVVLLRHVKGQANTSEREEGFLEALSEYPNIKVIEKDHYAGGNAEDAKKASRSLIAKLRQANGVFCPNETSTVGMLEALREAKLTGKIEFVGFDTPAIVVEALQNGEVSALIGQDPSRMGYESVKTLIDHIRGKSIAPKTDIDVRIITRKNLNDPDIQKLLALPSIVE